MGEGGSWTIVNASARNASFLYMLPNIDFGKTSYLCNFLAKGIQQKVFQVCFGPLMSTTKLITSFTSLLKNIQNIFSQQRILEQNIKSRRVRDEMRGGGYIFERFLLLKNQLYLKRLYIYFYFFIFLLSLRPEQNLLCKLNFIAYILAASTDLSYHLQRSFCINQGRLTFSVCVKSYFMY